MNEIKKNAPLQAFNTFNVQSLAQFFCEVTNIDDIRQLLSHAELRTLPKLILGGGSNILLTQDVTGLVIKNAIYGKSIIRENDQHVWITVGAGEAWHPFVLYCIKHNFAGIENLSLIPGTVGAAPIQNIGAYGVELKSVFDSLHAIDLETTELRSFTNQECQLGYRDSIFKHTLKNKYIITHVTFKLNKEPVLTLDYGNIQTMLDAMHIKQPTIKDVSTAVIKIRQQKLPDPHQLPNAGSFFKNPIISQADFKKLQQQYSTMMIPHYVQPNQWYKIPAAWLIDQCQLKGLKQNGVGISPNHALVIVNYSCNSGATIQQFANHIQQLVYTKFGIQLETEVNII